MKIKYVFVSFIVFLIFVNLAGAYEFPNYKDKYVNDFAGVLSSEQVGSLRSLFAGVEGETTAEVVFVSVDNLAGYDISEYAIQLASSWKIGKADKDNGLLILYAKEENKIWVATGYGVEGILPDSKIGRLLDENYVPLKDSGNVSEGIIAFSNVIANTMIENKDELLSSQRSGNSNISPFFVFVIVIIVLSILSRIFSSRLNRTRFWWIPIFLPSRIGGGSGSSFSGGGGFGGGGFGGGGAGR